MVDRERIKTMTHLSIYERGQGKRDIAMNQYSRADYIKYQMLCSSIFATIAFGIICFIFLLFGFDWFLNFARMYSYSALMGIIFLLYLGFIFIYRRYLRRIYDMRYTQMTLRLEEYRRELQRLEQIYKDERKMQF